MKTTAAQAAAMIRKEIKAQFPGLKFSCTSENYAGGNSIRIAMEDQPKATKDAIVKMTNKYQYGHFDGMTDYYEYSNVNDDLPQVKYLFVENRASDAKKEEIFQDIKKKWAGGEDLPDTYDEAYNVHFQGQWISQMVWQEFCKA